MIKRWILTMVGLLSLMVATATGRAQDIVQLLNPSTPSLSDGMAADLYRSYGLPAPAPIPQTEFYLDTRGRMTTAVPLGNGSYYVYPSGPAPPRGIVVMPRP
jgi:hypothetical protein